MSLNPNHKYERVKCEPCKGTGYTGKRRPGRPGSPFDHTARKGRCADCLGKGYLEMRVKA